MKKTESGQSAGPAARRRVMIVEDHPLVRQGLSSVINRQPDLVVSRDAATAAEALKILETDRPDVMVIDIVLQETNGVELIKRIHALDESLPMLALSMHDENLYAERVLRAGALGYVMKQEPVETVLAAIRRVLRGEVWVSDRVSGSLLRELIGLPHHQGGATMGVAGLSDRELEVFELIGAGLSTRDIAEKLHLGPKTVETHRAAIKSKLQLRTAVELVQHATLWVARSGGG